MWKTATARTTGTSHLRADLPCQDRFACEVLDDGTLIAVVADGAGSASNAERGADLVVSTIMEYLKHGIEDQRVDFADLVRDAVVRVRSEIAVEADRMGFSLRDYASTLLVALLTPHGGAAAQIGDGLIVVGEGNDEWCWVFWPQRREYANTTHFVTDLDALTRLEIDTLSEFVTDVAIMSDGLEPLVLHYESRVVHDPFFRAIFRPLVASTVGGENRPLSQSVEVFLSSERIRSRTDDDVSLILATRRT